MDIIYNNYFFILIFKQGLVTKKIGNFNEKIISIKRSKIGLKILLNSKKMKFFICDISNFGILNPLTEEKIETQAKTVNFDDFYFNQYNQKSNVCNFKNYIVIGGLLDGSFKIFKNFKEFEIKKFHFKMITCIACSETDEIIAFGSKDCRISIWKFKKIEKIKKKFIIYGHHNEIVAMKIHPILGILISVDLDGKLLIHNFRNAKFLLEIFLNLKKNEVIFDISIHSNGIFLLCSNLNQILIYRLKLFISSILF